MATLTRNLFWGRGETDHRLDVVTGHWPADMDGAVVVVGPDQRRPGGHWFGEHGLLCRIECRPDAAGRIAVRHRRVRTRVERLRRWLPFLFRRVAFVELSPFGVSNLANTNVTWIGDRLFVGYDAGRPVEVDPITLGHLTPVGGNDEWLQAAPGLLEPLVSVAAHPAPDHDERVLYFLNYTPVPEPGAADATAFVARWDLEGTVQRWRLAGVSELDSIHDVKTTRNHLVFADLPFVVEPETFRGAPRTRANQDFTRLWIVAKADLRRTEPGGTVHATEVRVPMPTGHLSVDEDDADGTVTVYCEHIPLADLMLPLTREERSQRTGELVDPNYEGLVTLGVQPGAVGRYRIDVAAGQVVDRDLATDDRFWGSVLATRDELHPDGRARRRDLWFAGVGFDPDLVSESWWALYADAGLDCLVAPADLPEEPIPAALTRFDLEAMKVAEVFTFPMGTFASPPTFVPRRGAEGPGDGYVVCVVHRDGAKQVQVFAAHDLERGPLAVATAGDFTPPLLLHSTWVPDRPGGRPSSYRVPLRRDLAGALAGAPRALADLVRNGRAMARAASDAGS